MSSRSRRNVVTIKETTKSRCSVVIPSAGVGSRMRTYGPTSLIKIEDEITVFERQKRLISQTIPNHEIVLVTGFESQKVINNTPRDIIHVQNERYQESNVVRSIQIGINAATTDNILVVYGDLVFNSATLSHSFQESSIVIDTQADNKNTEVGCIVHNEYLEQMCFDLPQKWSQVVYLTGKELSLFSKFANNPQNIMAFGFEAINWILEHGGRFKVLSNDMDIQTVDLDTSKDIKLAQSIL